jgi:hypothetical protein
VAGVPALTVTGNTLEFALDPQLLFAVTVISPLIADEPAVTVIELVVLFAVADHPLGRVQVYEVAPDIELIL